MITPSPPPLKCQVFWMGFPLYYSTDKAFAIYDKPSQISDIFNTLILSNVREKIAKRKINKGLMPHCYSYWYTYQKVPLQISLHVWTSNTMRNLNRAYLLFLKRNDKEVFYNCCCNFTLKFSVYFWYWNLNPKLILLLYCVFAEEKSWMNHNHFYRKLQPKLLFKKLLNLKR